MSYKEKPILKLYKYENDSFVMKAQIDDYQEASWENNLYSAGQFTITINFNIPNAHLFERDLFINFGENKFGVITTITDSIGEDGKGSQLRIITGYDARYIFKRRVIRNMNANGFWQMTAKGELCMRHLIADQCGVNSENKRKLPIVNTIPATEYAIGNEYSVSEQFSNLYDVLQTIATQSEIGWRLDFDGTNLTLIIFEGTNRSENIRFDTDYESLRNGEFSDSSESFSNTVYVGGKGQNEDRDIYEGEDLIEGNSPSGLDRFESWDNQSSLTTENEYETEAISMLTQYGQTLELSGNGLAKNPYEYEKEYFVGDTITVAFSGKSAKVQILSVTEHWMWNSYDIQFVFGKPKNNLKDQLQLMLRQIQKASDKSKSTESVKWYEIPDEFEMDKNDVTYDTIGFTGTANNNTFKLYLDDERTGAKNYNVYFKNLSGDKITLTTEKEDASDLEMIAGTYVASICVDEEGNITLLSATPSQTVQEGDNNPVTSDAVYQAIQGGGGGGMPVGSVTAYFGSTAPTGWFICDGTDTTGTADELQTNYPALYALLGNTNVLPDLRECVIVGIGQNTTNNISDHDVYALGEFKDDQLQSHTHSYTKFNTRKDVNWSSSQQIWVGVSSENTGTPTGRTGTTTHGKQVGLNYIIKAS